MKIVISHSAADLGPLVGVRGITSLSLDQGQVLLSLRQRSVTLDQLITRVLQVM